MEYFILSYDKYTAIGIYGLHYDKSKTLILKVIYLFIITLRLLITNDKTFGEKHLEQNFFKI